MNLLNLPRQEDVKTFDLGDQTIHLVDKPDIAAIMEVMAAPHIGQPCYFCGVPLTRADLDNAIRATDPPGKVELAHEECWNKRGA